MAINIKLIHAFEQLEAIEKATGDKKLELLKQYGSASPLNLILSLNFDSNVKLEIPSGMPPINPKYMDNSSHADLQGLLASAIGKLKYCLTSTDLKKSKKEQIFMDVIINCPLKDGEILCSAKDGALNELYPTITYELVGEVFPSYVNGE